ncbi:VC0807 family protein [Amycolatopsis minnesotensis]|uniref:Intracellular septation protein A n=1 Tax=Amycolatopsis minnesotensis TaxID=337894 RepID=A0ABN2RVA0_9PSEU
MTTVTAPAPAARSPREALRPLLIDIGAPLALYYGLHSGFGVSDVWALGAGAVVVAARTLYSLARYRRFELIATLVLVTSIAGIALSFFSGDAHFMIAKDAFGSGVVGIGILFASLGGKPVMSEAMRPFMAKTEAARATWLRLSATDAAFHRTEMRITRMWGVALFAECLVRVALAFTLPVPTMVWLSTVMMIGTMAGAVVLSGALAQPLEAAVEREVSPAAR